MNIEYFASEAEATAFAMGLEYGDDPWYRVHSIEPAADGAGFNVSFSDAYEEEFGDEPDYMGGPAYEGETYRRDMMDAGRGSLLRA